MILRILLKKGHDKALEILEDEYNELSLSRNSFTLRLTLTHPNRACRLQRWFFFCVTCALVDISCRRSRSFR